MGIADIGQHGHRGTHHFAHVNQVAEVIQPRFDDGGTVVLLQPQQRLGRADEVIIVRLGFQRGVMLTQYGGDHLLGGGLAGAAGDLHHGNVKLAAVPGGQRLQRQHGIGHPNVELAGQQGFRRLLAQTAHRALFQRGMEIGMAVKLLPHQRDKQLSFRDGTAVGGHTGDGSISGLQHRAAHRRAQGLYAEGNHLPAAFLTRRDSSTIFSHSSP